MGELRAAMTGGRDGWQDMFCLGTVYCTGGRMRLVALGFWQVDVSACE